MSQSSEQSASAPKKARASEVQQLIPWESRKLEVTGQRKSARGKSYKIRAGPPQVDEEGRVDRPATYQAENKSAEESATKDPDKAQGMVRPEIRLADAGWLLGGPTALRDGLPFWPPEAKQLYAAHVISEMIHENIDTLNLLRKIRDQWEALDAAEYNKWVKQARRQRMRYFRELDVWRQQQQRRSHPDQASVSRGRRRFREPPQFSESGQLSEEEGHSGT